MTVQIIATIIGLVIGGALLYLRNTLDRKNQPAGDRRIELIETLNRMREEGKGFGECATFLRQEGLSARVAEGLIIDARSEAIDDDLANLTTIEKSWCSFVMPGNWRLQQLSVDLDEDLFFTVESLGSAMVTFSFIEEGPLEADVDALLKESFEEFGKRLRDVEIVEPLRKWGQYSGKGYRLTGMLPNHPLLSRCILFVVELEGSMAIVNQSCNDESQARHQSALDLIENSFCLLR